MENNLKNETALQDIEDLALDNEGCEIVEFRPERYVRESLTEKFNDELDGWARHALASNGFGDY